MTTLTHRERLSLPVAAGIWTRLRLSVGQRLRRSGPATPLPVSTPLSRWLDSALLGLHSGERPATRLPPHIGGLIRETAQRMPLKPPPSAVALLASPPPAGSGPNDRVRMIARQHASGMDLKALAPELGLSGRLAEADARMLLITGLIRPLFAESWPFRLFTRDLWTHSVLTARAARFLATQSGWDPVEAFITGLLHDIGRLALIRAANQVFNLHRFPQAINRGNLLQLLADSGHDIGARYCEKSALSRRIADAIAAQAAVNPTQPLARLLRQANILAEAHQLTDRFHLPVERIREQLSELGVPEGRFDTFRLDLARRCTG